MATNNCFKIADECEQPGTGELFFSAEKCLIRWWAWTVTCMFRYSLWTGKTKLSLLDFSITYMSFCALFRNPLLLFILTLCVKQCLSVIYKSKQKLNYSLVYVSVIWAASRQNQHYSFATRMDPDQHARPQRLIRFHAVRLQTLLQVEKLIANSAGWSGSMLVANPLCWFCRDAAHLFS
jgi:hypothetical protein